MFISSAYWCTLRDFSKSPGYFLAELYVCMGSMEKRIFLDVLECVRAKVCGSVNSAMLGELGL